MLEEFIEFVDALFPSISNDIKDKAQEAIRQFKTEGKQINYLTKDDAIEELSQGDILDSVPFIYMDENGTEQTVKMYGIVLTTSCDIDHDDSILIASVPDLKDYQGKKDTITQNQTLTYLYFPDYKMNEKYIDFSLVNTYSSSLIKEFIKIGKIRRYASLSQVGYYMFLCKLSAFLLRREDAETQMKRFLESN